MKRKVAVIVFILFSVTEIFAEPVLTFGIFPSFNPKMLVQIFKPVADRISEYTGRQIILSSAPDRNTFQQRTLDGEYDIVWTCNACYFEVNEKAGFYAVASGEPSFRGVVMVKDGSSIYSLSDLKDKKIVAVNPSSIAGYLFFRNEMSKLNLYAPEDYEIVFNEKIEVLPFLVIKGNYDAVVFSEDTYFGSDIYESISKQLRSIAYSIEIPQFPFAVSPELDSETVEQIQDALVSFSMRKNEDADVLESMNIDKISSTEDSDYDEFRTLYYEVKNFGKR